MSRMLGKSKGKEKRSLIKPQDHNQERVTGFIPGTTI